MGSRQRVLLVQLLAVLVLAVGLAAAADAPNNSTQKPAPGADQKRQQALQKFRDFIAKRRQGSEEERTPKQKRMFPKGQIPFIRRDPVTGRAAANPTLPTVWVVQLSTAPAAVSLAPPTEPTAAIAAARLDPTVDSRGRNFTAARVHAVAVDARISAVATAAGVESRVLRRFTYALSGFTVKNLTLADLQALRANPEVLSVTPSRPVRPNTYTSPWFLGLTSQLGESSGTDGGNYEPQGLWDKLGGVLAPNGAGEDVVIGVMDTGLWNEGTDHPSFFDKAYWLSANDLQGQYYSPAPKWWRGTCQPNQDGTSFPCNNKVIGCRWFADSYVASYGGLPDGEFAGCRDMGGHGTHTAGTAGGNYGVQTPYTPSDALLSGMAPRARLAIYKVCWADECFDADILAAVDSAIADGVDILSVSLGADYEWNTMATPGQIAYMNAARAGVFMSLAAGNSGPTPSTASNNGPWSVSVAASTIPRQLWSMLVLGNGDTVPGVGYVASNHGPKPLYYASDADAQLCDPDSLDPDQAAGKIVVCDRGGIYGRVSKSYEVRRAGGVGMVLADTPISAQGYVVSVSYAVPTTHILQAHRQAVINYATQAGATATLQKTVVDTNVVAPEMADFSSRGPFPVANGAVMEPDVTAPGVDIYAAVSRADPTNLGYDYYSGTSMACPHVSGVAALLKDKHPRWNPMTIKSALMTTAITTNTAGQSFGNALDYGAGHINPTAAVDPGLVITSTPEDWMTLLCAAEPWPESDSTCETLCPSSAQTKAVRQLRAKAHPAGDANNKAGAAYDRQHHQYEDEADGAPSDQHYYYGHDRPDVSRPGLIASTCPLDKVSFDINGPSISGNVGGSMVVQRTVTAVCSEQEGPLHFTATTSVTDGSSFAIEVWPSSLKLSDGESATVTITISALSDTPMDTYQFGQVVWVSNMGHVVRVPVSVNFRPVLAPEVIAPPVDAASFTYDFGIRTAGPAKVNVRTTSIQAAEIVAVDCYPDEGEEFPYGLYFFSVPAGGVDYFAAGTFVGDQQALFKLWLFNDQTAELIAVARMGGNLDTLMVVEAGLPEGGYLMFLEPLGWDEEEFTAYLNVWQLSYGNTQGPGLMQVTPNPVPVGADGMGLLSLSITAGLPLPGANDLPPTRYLGALGYAREGSTTVTDTTRVVFFKPFVTG